MTAPRFRIYDPMRDEWAAPSPALHPVTGNPSEAAIFSSEAAAIIHARRLIGPSRPWLVMQPVCPHCLGLA